MLDLLDPKHAYLFGLLQTDGHMSRGPGKKGRISLELIESDRATLEEFVHLFPVHSTVGSRSRDTNFRKGARSAIWRAYSLELRAELEAAGLPYGRKSDVVRAPRGRYAARDYFRGLVDGDGSLGLTANGFPFLSFTTKSPDLAQAYVDFVLRVCGKVKTTRPNARDSIYNICVCKEDAQRLAAVLYPTGALCLARKAENARVVQAWVRPPSMVQVTWERRRWTWLEDILVDALPHALAAEVLRRTERSIRVRKSRLKVGGASVTEVCS